MSPGFDSPNMDTRHTHATQSPNREQDTTDVEKAEKLAKDKRARKEIGQLPASAGRTLGAHANGHSRVCRVRGTNRICR
jgi:thiamine pyrophosphokinase